MLSDNKKLIAVIGANGTAGRRRTGRTEYRLPNRKNHTLKVTRMSDMRYGRPKHRGDKPCPLVCRPC